MGEGAQQSYLSWQSTQRRYECSGEKQRERRTRGFIPYHGEQVPIYSTNKRDTWRVRAASSSSKVCVIWPGYIQSTQWGRPSSGGTRQEVRVTEQCELHTSLSHQRWVCSNGEGECLVPRFCPQHFQHLLGFSMSTYLALLRWAVSSSMRLAPGNRCYLSTCLVQVPDEPSQAKKFIEIVDSLEITTVP